MKKLLILSLLLLPTIVNAQVPTELTIKASPAEADLIWKALRKMPVEEAEVFMAKMRQQIMEQTQPKKVEVPKVEEKK